MRALKLQPQIGSRPPPAIGHHWAFIAGQLLYGKFVLQDNYWYFVIQQAPSTDIDFDNGNWIAAEWGDVWHPAQSQPAVPRQWGEKGANIQQCGTGYLGSQSSSCAAHSQTVPPRQWGGIPNNMHSVGRSSHGNSMEYHSTIHIAPPPRSIYDNLEGTSPLKKATELMRTIKQKTRIAKANKRTQNRVHHASAGVSHADHATMGYMDTATHSPSVTAPVTATVTKHWLSGTGRVSQDQVQQWLDNRSRHATTSTVEDNSTGSPSAPFTEQRMATSRPMNGSCANANAKHGLAACQQAMQPSADQTKHQAAAMPQPTPTRAVTSKLEAERPKLDATKRQLWRPGKPKVPKHRQPKAKADASAKALVNALQEKQVDGMSQHSGKRKAAKPESQPEVAAATLHGEPVAQQVSTAAMATRHCKPTELEDGMATSHSPFPRPPHPLYCTAMSQQWGGSTAGSCDSCCESNSNNSTFKHNKHVVQPKSPLPTIHEKRPRIKSILVPPRNRPTMVHVVATPTAATQPHFIPDEKQPVISSITQFKAPERQSVEPRVKTATDARSTARAPPHGEPPAVMQITALDQVATTLKIPTIRPGSPPLYGTPSAIRLVPNEDNTNQPTTGAASYSIIVQKEQELAAYLASPEASFYPVPIHRQCLDFC